jgi:hypothetical protein
MRGRSAVTASALRSTRSCAWIAVDDAPHAAIRSSSHSSMKAENWFQLRIVGVTTKTRDSDSGQSPLMRCGKYVSRACTLDLAPVQVLATFGVLLNRRSRRRSASSMSSSNSVGRRRFSQWSSLVRMRAFEGMPGYLKPWFVSAWGQSSYPTDDQSPVSGR